jgi:hypothetical protein
LYDHRLRGIGGRSRSEAFYEQVRKGVKVLWNEEE